MTNSDPDMNRRAAERRRGESEAPSGSAPALSRAARLSPAEFAARLQDSSRALWCIAAGVTGNRGAAEDLVQEAAAVALTKLDEFDPRTSFLAWMGQIVRYLALNERRRQGREKTALADPALRSAVGPRASASDRTAPALTGRGELLRDQDLFDDRITSAMSLLDETPRCCLLLRIVMNLPYREIAQALSIPEGTAMSHVHRSRRLLRDRLTHDASPTDERSSP